YAQALHDCAAPDGAAHAGPVAIRYPRGSSALVASRPDPAPIALGQAQVLRQGHPGGVAVIALGICCEAALTAAEELAADDISITVVNARFVKPLDHALIATLAARCTTIVTVEEHSAAGGFGSAVLESLSDRDLKTRVVRLAIADRFVGHATQAAQRRECGLDGPAIAAAVRKAYAGDGSLTKRARPSAATEAVSAAS
ncbi:MAG: hypothetical protein M3T49_05305, partial [Candidatus Eremiobacteraeota bacterium]|nr:hypothetical protein [Candidatus Eremiobacteraeota bacterium]